MKFILLYGPMAAGKLTIAKEFKKVCDFNEFPIKIFHNHHTVNLISEFIPPFTEEWFHLNSLYRLKMFETCAKIGQNLISTIVYAKNFDDGFIHKLIEVVEKHEGSIYFVHLTADLDVIYSRLENEDRKKNQKLTSLNEYEKTLSKYDIFSPISFVENLSFDTTTNSPEIIARQIFKVITRNNID